MQVSLEDPSDLIWLDERIAGEVFAPEFSICGVFVADRIGNYHADASIYPLRFCRNGGISRLCPK